jgi:hypothetical protein
MDEVEDARYKEEGLTHLTHLVFLVAFCEVVWFVCCGIFHCLTVAQQISSTHPPPPCRFLLAFSNSHPFLLALQCLHFPTKLHSRTLSCVRPLLEGFLQSPHYVFLPTFPCHQRGSIPSPYLGSTMWHVRFFLFVSTVGALAVTESTLTACPSSGSKACQTFPVGCLAGVNRDWVSFPVDISAVP